MTFSGRNILVLGGSGSLGSLMTTSLLNQGAQVIATAHSQESVGRIPDGASSAILDLTSTASIQGFIDEMKNSHASIDGVVIASGRVGFSPAESTSYEMLNQLMQINALGPAAVIKGLFPLLQAHQSEKACVMGITGIVVDQTFPGMSAYTASKTALASYLQSIAKEWRRYKIRTLDVRLGHTETGLATRPLFGEAPTMPTGHEPQVVVTRLIELLSTGDGIISDVEFND